MGTNASTRTDRGTLVALVLELEGVGDVLSLQEQNAIKEARNIAAMPHWLRGDELVAQTLASLLQEMVSSHGEPYTYYGTNPQYPGVLGWWPNWEAIHALPVGPNGSFSDYAQMNGGVVEVRDHIGRILARFPPP